VQAHHARGEKTTLVVAQVRRRRPKRVLRREPQGPPEGIGGNSGSDSVVARSIGCSYLKCGIAKVGQTYLWLRTFVVERHERKAV